MNLSRILSRAKPGPLRFVRSVSGLVVVAVPVVFGTLGFNLGSIWYWGMASIVVPIAVHTVFRRAVPLAEARIRARERWMSFGPGVERVTYTRLEHFLDRYADLTRDEASGYVDDRTWADLGMGRIREEMDVCFTIAGRNELTRILRHVLPDADTARERISTIRSFITDADRREAVALALATVGEEADADPADLLFGEVEEPDSRLPLFVGMSTFSVASILVAAFANLTLGLIGVVVAFIANMWVYYRKARLVSARIPALRVLSRMMEAHRALSTEGGAIVGAEGVVAGKAKGSFGLLLTGAPSPSPSVSGDITEVFLLYVKIFFQIDLIAYNRIIRFVRAHRDALRGLYRRLGTLDALYSLASARSLRPHTCDAEVYDPPAKGGERAGAPVAEGEPVGAPAEEGSGASSEDDSGVGGPDGDGAGGAKSMRLGRVYHPLIDRAIANTISLEPPGAVVTGTNMAGKSTFLRTVGINVLFAQTAGFVFAGRYRAPRFRLMSSIEKRDDLASGKSFYYDEADRIYRMIERVGDGPPVLLLIDELLAGTNSLERESASIAILRYLSERSALTIAATHDVAIAKGVRGLYALHYFTDQANENGLSFDYKIHEGVVPTRNAIKLLRLIGYPEDVIAAALEGTGAGESGDKGEG